MTIFFRIFALFQLGICCFASGNRRECSECPEKWTHYNGFCYRYFSEKKTWDEAHSFCDSVYAGGYVADRAYLKVRCDLPSIHSAKEQEFLYTFWKSVRGENEHSLWIGLNDLRRDRDFDWVDASPVDYTNWAPNEPNNYEGRGEHYGTIRLDGKWNDYYKTNFAFVCKMKRV